MLSVRMGRLVGVFVTLYFFAKMLFSSLFALYPPSRYDGWRGFGGYDRRLMKLEGMRQVGAALAERRRERDAIEQEIRGRVQGASEADFMRNPRYKELTAEIETLAKKNDPVGAVIARGLAGSDWEALEDITIASPAEGFLQGITIRTSRALGDLVAKKVENTVDRILGNAWDAALDKVVELAHDAKSMLFHQSNDPFTPDELKNWSDVVASCLEGFGKLIKGRVEFESRSKDMNSRAFDSEDQSTVNQDQIIAERLLKHYAMQCDYYAQMIDKRKGYYKEDSEIVFIADQLRDWLIEFKNIVLSIKSLKDVSAKFGSNITMITETAMNIKKLFEKLWTLVTPPSYAPTSRDVKRTTPTFSDTTPRRDYAGRYGVGGDLEYPQPYPGYDY
jgi:hypothetical protein